jgi:outer membrane beta-barrel protein
MQNLLGHRGFIVSFGFFCAIAFSTVSKADAIEFADEELAQESVVPVFDQPLAVKKRNILTDGRIELSLYSGFFLNEAFFSPIALGGSATYHITETHGIQLMGSALTAGLSTYGEALKNNPNSGVRQNYELAPAPKSLAMLFYEWTPFYGKISITKQTVQNISLSFQAGGGMIGIGDENLPALGAGVTQRFFFGKSWGLYADLKSVLYQGPNLASVNLGPTATNTITTLQPVSAFEKTLKTNFLFNIGAMFLL